MTGLSDTDRAAVREAEAGWLKAHPNARGKKSEWMFAAGLAARDDGSLPEGDALRDLMVDLSQRGAIIVDTGSSGRVPEGDRERELREAAQEVLNTASHDTRMPRRFRVVALGALNRLDAALAVPTEAERGDER